MIQVSYIVKTIHIHAAGPEPVVEPVVYAAGQPGSDVSGTVLALGPHKDGTSKLRVGERVFGLAHGCLGTLVTGPSVMLHPHPPSLTLEEAATIPTVFLTIEAALSGAVREGDRVLVHAAAGGVGLASIQAIRNARGRFHATAGSSSKRSLLRGMGVECVSGSRHTLFVEDHWISSCEAWGRDPDISASPDGGGGGGVDLILNSLTSPAMVAASLSLLKTGGAWIELGKRDIWSHQRAMQERPDVNYSYLAIDFLPPRLLGSLLARVATKLASGTYQPLPAMTFGLGMQQVVHAFRCLAQANHVGKVVITRAGGSALAAQSHPLKTPGPFSNVAITGGTGGLGLLIAEWLSSQGLSDRLLLLSRSGRFGGSRDDKRWGSIFGSQSQVTILSSDVSCIEDCSFASHFDPSHPIDCLFHASGVLTDALAQNQTPSKIRQALGPKVKSTNKILKLSAALGNSY